MATPEPVFTKQDLQDWNDRFFRNEPPMPGNAECITAPDLTGATGKARQRGITMRLAIDTGATVTINIDPVAAMNIMRMIVEAGMICGWLDGNGNIRIPR